MRHVGLSLSPAVFKIESVKGQFFAVEKAAATEDERALSSQCSFPSLIYMHIKVGEKDKNEGNSLVCTETGKVGEKA